MNLIDVSLKYNQDNTEIVLADNVRIPLPGTVLQQPAFDNRDSICFGVRPEHIDLVDDHAEAENTCSGLLTVVENMGNEKYLYFQVGHHELIARVFDQTITTSDIGRTLCFKINTEYAHFFDINTGGNITTD